MAGNHSKNGEELSTDSTGRRTGYWSAHNKHSKVRINIPSCDDIILESLQWNIPRMEQFYFRFIRLDSEQKKRVHFVTYDESIEQNLLALVTTKERLNEFIKLGEIREESEIFEEFDLTPSLIEKLLTRQRDNDGKLYVSWGNQRIVAA